LQKIEPLRSRHYDDRRNFDPQSWLLLRGHGFEDEEQVVADTGGKEPTGMGSSGSDLGDLQRDVARLKTQVEELTSQKGSELLHRARAGVDEVVAKVETKGAEAADALRDFSRNLTGAIDRSLEQRPYTTLAMALAAGFLLGVTRR
jgi:ElaB/YqjD/DUF883 family membrane-anchored ribosome-binding protein